MVFLRSSILILLISTNAFSQFRIQGKVIASGAVNVSGDGLIIQATVGQPAIGAASNDDLNHFAGFWYQPVEIVTSIDKAEDATLPRAFRLEQNYPNPFNPATNIQFSVPKASEVTIKLHDILGRVVTTLVKQKYQAGTYKIQFEASDLPSGIYIYRIQAEGFVKTRKMMFLK